MSGCDHIPSRRRPASRWVAGRKQTKKIACAHGPRSGIFPKQSHLRARAEFSGTADGRFALNPRPAWGAALVLLIAGINLAGLQIARNLHRAHELGVRHALGASRARLLSQLVAENVTLSLAGGAVAIVFAVLTLRAVAQFAPASAWHSEQMASSGAVLLYTLGLSLASGFAVGCSRHGAPRHHATEKWLRARFDGLESAARGRISSLRTGRAQRGASRHRNPGRSKPQPGAPGKRGLLSTMASSPTFAALGTL